MGKKPKSTFSKPKKFPSESYDFFVYDFYDNLLSEGQVKGGTIDEALNKAMAKASQIQKTIKKVMVKGKILGKNVERMAWCGGCPIDIKQSGKINELRNSNKDKK